MTQQSVLSAGDEVFEIMNDYTLSVVYDFNRMSKADSELRRLFNFKARQITEIYSMWYCSSLSSNTQTQKFSDLDSLEEVQEMRQKLIDMGGHPPEIDNRERLRKNNPALGH